MPDFMAMVTEKYAGPLPVSIRQALRYYPDAKYYVYGCDLKPETLAKLKAISPSVVVHEWTLLYLPVAVKYNRRFARMKMLGMLRDLIKSYLTGRFLNKSMESLFAAQRFEVIIQNKLRVIKHHNDTYKKPFVFIDADAFLINSFDELLDSSFDIGFTVREKSRHSYAHNRCALLFAGIFWFLGNYERNRAFIDEWCGEARKTDEINSEQTSLARWLHRLTPHIYDEINATHNLEIGGETVRVRTLDANVYNATAFEGPAGFDAKRDRERVKVLHLKNSRFETPLFKKLADELGIEV